MTNLYNINKPNNRQDGSVRSRAERAQNQRETGQASQIAVGKGERESTSCGDRENREGTNQEER